MDYLFLYLYTPKKLDPIGYRDKARYYRGFLLPISRSDLFLMGVEQFLRGCLLVCSSYVVVGVCYVDVDGGGVGVNDGGGVVEGRGVVDGFIF